MTNLQLRSAPGVVVASLVGALAVLLAAAPVLPAVADGPDGASGLADPGSPATSGGTGGVEVAEPGGTRHLDARTDAGPGTATADDAQDDAHDATADLGADPDADPAVTLASTAPFRIRPAVARVGAITPEVLLHGSGWGHGVGMSQYGAYAQAQAGRSASQILTHYYPGTQVTTDTRASEQRIRVGILAGVASTVIDTIDGEVAWLRCRPDEARGETVGGRVTDCEPWFTQPQGTSLRACPFRARDDEDVLREGVRIVDPTAAAGCDAEPLHESLGFPVARVDHDGTAIRTDSHLGRTPYRHGWRDLHARTDLTLTSVQDVPSVELYLRGLAEVPSLWGRLGPAALEAQAITGRTFALGRLGLSPACACDLRATPADQNYSGYAKESEMVGAERVGDLWVAAVDATTDQVLTFEGALAQTFYSSSHGGRSENIEDSWAYGPLPIPYLRSVDDPWSLDPRANNPRASWTATATNRDMATLLSAGQPQAIVRVERVAIGSRTDGGTPRTLAVTGVTSGGQRVSFTTDLGDRYAKGIAGAAMRRELPVTGGANNRLYSSQLSRIGFAPFTDDDGSVHEYAITWAHTAGVVRGVDATRFRPNRPVTRAQMATYLVNTFDIPAVAIQGRFPDVDPSNVHLANIEALTASGIASGYADGSFRPDQPVTRAQMATFLANTLALTTTRSGTFTDVVAGDVHGANIEAIAERGITTGCDATRFCGGDPVERGQLASFLQRVVLG